MPLVGPAPPAGLTEADGGVAPRGDPGSRGTAPPKVEQVPRGHYFLMPNSACNWRKAASS